MIIVFILCFLKLEKHIPKLLTVLVSVGFLINLIYVFIVKLA